MVGTSHIDIGNQLDEIPDLLPFPSAVTRLLNACNDKNVGAKELCEIVSTDPGLCLQLLKIANSSAENGGFFSFNRI